MHERVVRVSGVRLLAVLAGRRIRQTTMTKTELQDLGGGYTKAWCNQRAADVAFFYAEDASLTINKVRRLCADVRSRTPRWNP